MENVKGLDVKNKLEYGVTFKISPFKEMIKRTVPHKHDDYYELVFLNRGEGFHCVESEKFLIAAPEFYFLKPGQLHYWEFTEIPKGFVILFKEAEFDPVSEKQLVDMVKRIPDLSRFSFSEGHYPEPLLFEMHEAFKNPLEFSQAIIHGLLMALLGKLLNMGQKEMVSSMPASVYKRFQDLLATESPRLHKVHEFAELLNVTPQNLNVLCRKGGGRSAGEMITAQLVLEAKRYILHTDCTIQEVADRLSFSDASNFVKFFKKHTSLTPVQFRGQYFQ